MSEIDLLVKFEVRECGECGQSYALTKSFLDKRRSDHKTFYCPNGDPRHYPQMSSEERLQKQIEHCRTDMEFWKDSYDSKAEHLQSVQRSRSAYKGTVTRMKKAAHPENGATR